MKMVGNPAVILIIISLLLYACNKAERSPSAIGQSSKDKPQSAEKTVQKEVILFFGNSLTAGYGLDPEQAFPHLIQLRLDSLGFNYQVVNAGLSGETTASGVNRIEWVLREPASIMVLELGGNDGLRGIDPEETKKNLQKIIDLSRKKYPEIRIILAGMEAPPNMGQIYIQSFRSIFPQLATANELPLIPFLLQDVGGEAALNLEDGIHPNEAGHKIVAENVWSVLSSELRAKSIAGGGN